MARSDSPPRRVAPTGSACRRSVAETRAEAASAPFPHRIAQNHCRGAPEVKGALFLQSKLDVFGNQRTRPIFQVKLDNPAHTFGTFVVKVASDQNNGPGPAYDFAHPTSSQALDGLDFSVGPLTYN